MNTNQLQIEVVYSVHCSPRVITVIVTCNTHTHTHMQTHIDLLSCALTCSMLPRSRATSQSLTNAIIPPKCGCRTSSMNSCVRADNNSFKHSDSLESSVVLSCHSNTTAHRHIDTPACTQVRMCCLHYDTGIKHSHCQTVCLSTTT